MRGFAFVGGDGPPPEVDLGIAEGDLVVAADSGLAAAEARGLRADWVVGDMDSLEDRSLLDRYPAERIRTFPADKDDTDTEIALRFLRSLGCGDIAVVGGGGGRLDHLLAVAALFEREESPRRWVTGREDARLVDAARPEWASVAMTADAGTLVSVFPVGSGPWRAKSRGLKWPLDDLAWERGRFGVSNVSVGARCAVESVSGRFLVILPLGFPIRSGRTPP